MRTLTLLVVASLLLLTAFSTGASAQGTGCTEKSFDATLVRGDVKVGTDKGCQDAQAWHCTLEYSTEYPDPYWVCTKVL